MSIVTAATIVDEVESGLLPSDMLFEEVEGQRVELPPMGSYAEVLATRLLCLLYMLVDGRKLGFLTAETLFVLDAEKGLKRRPDIAFVSHERWPEGKPIPPVGIWDVIPDLAVEVISPTDLDLEVTTKLREYFKHGVRQVWQVRPIEGLVYIYDSPTSVAIHERTDTIDCGPILGNVRLALGSVFQQDAEK
jgi:Uma2 family endonuclease